MTKREKNLLCFGVIIILIAVYTAIVLPYIGLTNTKNEETEALHTEIEVKNQKLTLIPNLEQQVEQNQTKLDGLKNIYNKAQTQEAIATYFTNLAEQNLLEVTAFSQKSTNELLTDRDLELFSMAEVTISCRGDYSNYIAMVDTLNQREDITILSLSCYEKKQEVIFNEYTITCLLLMNE